MDAPSPFIASLLVALGGAFGSVFRYQTGRVMAHWFGVKAMTAFPWPTLTVNVLGSLAMGLLAGWLSRFGHGGEQWRLLIGVGVLGGFTTFSSFSLELMLLVERGQPAQAFLYGAASLMAGLAALYIGLASMRMT